MLTTERVGFACGAKVTGIDLSASPSDDDIRAIHTAWLRHLVLVFPGQRLDPVTLVEFTRRFGQLDDYATQPFARHPDFNEVMVLTNKRTDGQLSKTHNNGQNWHSDLSYTLRPAKGTSVYCMEKPSAVATPCSPTCTSRTKACHRSCERFSMGSRLSTMRA